MSKNFYCALCDIMYPYYPEIGCPCCKTNKLLKIAEDEALKSEEHARKQEDRADKLETKYENLLSHIENVIGDGWDGAEAEEIQSYLRYAIKDGNNDY